jgi:predicted outer membrane repeat protein
MRQFLLAGIMIGLTAGSALAQATCASGPYLAASDMQTDFSGKYVYGGTAPNNYDELHVFSGSTSGNIQDYKKGPSDPIDPTTPTSYATFSINTTSSPNTITYTYAAGYTTPALSVISNGSNSYTFCNGGAIYTTSTASGAPGFGGPPP